MNTWSLALGALSAEIASFALLDGSASDLKLAGFIALHALASALATLLAWRLLPAPYRRRGQLWGAGLVFCMAFFAPGVGVVSLLIIIHVALRYPRALSTSRYVAIDRPSYVANEKDDAKASDLRVGYARRVLTSGTESVDTKLRVLLAVQDMRPKVAVPMLQDLLGDPSEDIRLLAYSMIDAWEKDITRRIQSAQAVLDELSAQGHESDGDSISPDSSSLQGNGAQVRSKPARGDFRRLAQMQAKSQWKARAFNAHRRLAELYWEQVDTKLARGDLRKFALTKAKDHCESALELQAENAGVWLLFSEVLAELGMRSVARRALQAARGAGADFVKTHQLLARLAFERGRYQRVQTYMSQIDESERVSFGLRQVARFWAGRSVDVPL